MAFKTCPPQPQEKLAFFAPEGGIHGYGLILNGHHRYWSKQKTAASPDSGLHLAASVIQKELFESTSDWLGMQQGLLTPRPRLLEQARRRAIGSLGISIILRRLVRLEQESKEARLYNGEKLGFTNIAVDAFADHQEIPLEHRIHPTPAIASEVLDADIVPGNEQERWFQQNSLYVKCVQPANPTDQMVLFAMEREMAFRPDTLITLYPYLAAQNR